MDNERDQVVNRGWAKLFCFASIANLNNLTKLIKTKGLLFMILPFIDYIGSIRPSSLLEDSFDSPYSLRTWKPYNRNWGHDSWRSATAAGGLRLVKRVGSYHSTGGR